MREGDGRHRLILFDIDGTLIHTGGAGSRAMTRAFAEACNIDHGFDGIPVPGRTDTVILADALTKWGVDAPPDFVPAFQKIYFRCLSEELARLPGSVRGILPGVEALLDALGRSGAFTVALLTGNYAASARLKLEHFDLWRRFAFGAFGDDAVERDDLVRVAIQRGRRAGMPEVEPGDVVVVGDTPLDVACGRSNGARVLAVATGSFTVKALVEAGADKAVHDLSETAAILAWLGSACRR
jgi:phosphoglycolate phosphatase-like HAD superfamily hydrolase